MFDAAAFARDVVAAIKESQQVLQNQIAALEARIMEMEKHVAEIKYTGVWRDGETYKRGNSCTHDGSIWIALRDTEGKPGQSLEWQLAVRKGKDGKAAA